MVDLGTLDSLPNRPLEIPDVDRIEEHDRVLYVFTRTDHDIGHEKANGLIIELDSRRIYALVLVDGGWRVIAEADAGDEVGVEDLAEAWSFGEIEPESVYDEIRDLERRRA